MRWTLGRRIAAGYGAILVLLLAAASLGAYALSRTAEGFDGLIRTRERSLLKVLEAKGTAEAANVEFLRYLLGSEEAPLREREATLRATHQQLVELRDGSPHAELRAGWEETLDLFEAWGRAQAEAIARADAGHAQEALRIRKEQVSPARLRFFASVERNLEAERTFAQDATRATLAGASQAVRGLLGVAALALFLGVGIARALSRSITVPLRKLTDAVEKVRAGALEQRAQVDAHDEIGDLAAVFNLLVERLKQSNDAIRETVGALASAAAEIVAATTQQASGAAEEATAVHQTSTTVDEVKQTAQLSAHKARGVAEAAQRSVDIAQDGRHAVDDTVRGMQDTKGRMESIAERVLGMSEQAQAIGEVIAAVNDLAEQSNLLAVNAAIEAAKAGEAGKGFAVVAGEVKALAEESKQATARVRAILNDIQRATQAAVMAAEQGVKASDTGVALAGRSGQAIQSLSESLTESAQSGQQILASTQQQAAGMDQIALAMRNIQQASAQSLAATQQAERAAHDLNELAGRLKALVLAAGESIDRSRPPEERRHAAA